MSNANETVPVAEVTEVKGIYATVLIHPSGYWPEGNLKLGDMLILATQGTIANATVLGADILLEVIRSVRQYPDFDEPSWLTEMMDQALSGQVPTSLATIDALSQGLKPIPQPSAQPSDTPVTDRKEHQRLDVPIDPQCSSKLDELGDDRGQGLDEYWKYGFRSGWHHAKASPQVAQPSNCGDERPCLPCYLDQGACEVVQPSAVHSDDAAIDRFAVALKGKLAQARAKGRSGREGCDPRDISNMLREHVEKGDPRDVANFCMFLWANGDGITADNSYDQDGVKT